MRLRTSLLLMCLVAALPITTLALIAASWIVDEENSRFVVATKERNRATVAAVDAELRGTINALRAIVSSARVSPEDLQAFQREAATILRGQSSWRDLMLSDASGRVLASARRPAGRAQASQPPFVSRSFDEAVSKQAPTVDDLTLTPEFANEAGVSVRVPVVQGERSVYVLTAVLDPAVFQRILVDQRVPADWVSGLVDLNGRIVARVPEVQMGSFASTDYRQAVSKSDEGWYRGRTIEGRDTYTAYYRSPMTGWTLGYAIPAKVVLAASTRAAWLLGAGIVLSIVSIVVIGLWLSRRITEPMARVSEAAAGLPRGEHVAMPTSEIQEVNELASAIEQAGRSIETRDRALRRQTEELLRTNTRKSEFLALLAHELRNPLAPLRNGVALITLQRDPERLAEIQGMMDRQVRHMTRLVEDLLDVSRIDRGQLELRRERVAVDAILMASIETIKPSIEAREQRLVVRYAPTPLFVDGDPVRLSQAISNLLNNASKFTPKGGSIELESEARGDRIVLRVTDSGAGFEPRDAQRIFDLFVQADPKLSKTAGGLGIGLTLVQFIVKMHGGIVEARSEGVGKGACFVVTLPAAAATLLAAPAAKGELEKLETTRVLVVDDNRDAALSLAELLRCHAFEAREAFTANDGLVLAAAFKPDVIFVDLHMPHMSGREFAQRVRAMDWAKDVRIALLTGAVMRAQAEALEAEGIEALFLKPIELQTAISFASRQTDNVVALRPGAGTSDAA